MLGQTRSLVARIVPRSSAKVVAPAKVAKQSHGFAARAVSGHKLTNMTKLSCKSYSINPYLQIKKPEVGSLSSMDMIAQVPPIVVPGKTAACDGGEGSLGHPRVFIALHLSTVEDAACCEYCGLRFISTDYLEKEEKAGNKLERGVHFLEPADLPEWEYNAHGLGDHH